MDDTIDRRPPRSLEEKLFVLPGALPGATEWEKAFIRSILGQRNRKNWRPSAKQMQFINRIVDSLYDDDPAGLVVIDDGDDGSEMDGIRK